MAALYCSSLSINFSFSQTHSQFPNYTLLYTPSRLRHLRIISCLSIDQTSNSNVTAVTGTHAAEALRVVLAASGTGGHIYPAIAIADELKYINPDAQILILGTPNGMESTAVPTAGYQWPQLPPPQQSLLI